MQELLPNPAKLLFVWNHHLTAFRPLLLVVFCHPARLLKQIRRLNPKRSRKLINNINACCIDASFERTDVRTIDARAMRQLFLGQAAFMTKPP